MDKLCKNNTRIERREDSWSIFLHGHEIITVYPTKIILHSHGYKTRTTLSRFNQASNQWSWGFKVFQKKFSWYVLREKRDSQGAEISYEEFHDGMEIPL